MLSQLFLILIDCLCGLIMWQFAKAHTGNKQTSCLLFVLSSMDSGHFIQIAILIKMLLFRPRTHFSISHNLYLSPDFILVNTVLYNNNIFCKCLLSMKIEINSFINYFNNIQLTCSIFLFIVLLKEHL